MHSAPLHSAPLESEDESELSPPTSAPGAEYKLENENSTEALKQSCPSCGDESTLAERTEAGSPLLCPVCGAEIASDTNAAETPAPMIAGQQSGPIRTEDLLLERLIATPKIPDQVPTPTLVVILTAIIAIGIGVYFATKNPEKFAADTSLHSATTSAANDSTELFQQRTLRQPTLDSLKRVLDADPRDSSALLALANDDFDLQYWADSKQTFEQYLKDHPTDVDARIDYATTIDKVENNPEAAINQIEKVLEKQPNHVRALFNGGILSLKIVGKQNHAEALAQAKSYFERARQAAETQDTSVLPTIDGILSEISKVHPATPPE